MVQVRKDSLISPTASMETSSRRGRLILSALRSLFLSSLGHGRPFSPISRCGSGCHRYGITFTISLLRLVFPFVLLVNLAPSFRYVYLATENDLILRLRAAGNKLAALTLTLASFECSFELLHGVAFLRLFICYL